jgi:hypothetical protein
MSRHYKKAKKKYPSVTTIIGECVDSSGALTQWAANMCKDWIKENCAHDFNWGSEEGFYEVYDAELDEMRFNFRKVSQKALDIGSEVHGAIELDLKDELCLGKLTRPESLNAFNAFLEWKLENHLEPIALEQTVWGNRWAGTLDMICMLDGVKTVVDFKTSKDFYWDSMGPQIAAYKSVTDATHCGILRLDKESGMPFYRDRTKYYERDLEIFQHMLEIYFLRHPILAKQFKGE